MSSECLLGEMKKINKIAYCSKLQVKVQKSEIKYHQLSNYANDSDGRLWRFVGECSAGIVANRTRGTDCFELIRTDCRNFLFIY